MIQPIDVLLFFVRDLLTSGSVQMVTFKDVAEGIRTGRPMVEKRVVEVEEPEENVDHVAGSELLWLTLESMADGYLIEKFSSEKVEYCISAEGARAGWSLMPFSERAIREAKGQTLATVYWAGS